MSTAYSMANLEAAARLYSEAANAQSSKTALAAMIAEAFVNGMTAQERMTQDSAPDRVQQ